MSSALTAWLACAPEWILGLPDWLQDFFYSIFRCFIYDDRYLMLVKGLGNTLLLTFGALIIGVILGVLVSLIRVTYDRNISEMRPGFGRGMLKFGNVIAKIYLTVIRGTPMVVQILLMYLVFLASVDNKIVVGILAFGINSGAYVAEIIRSGIMSVDIGQTEAGRSLGFGYVPTMRYVILPQAFKTVLPTLANEFIVLIKETAVAGYIGLADLTYAGNIIGGITFDYFTPLITVAIIYLLMVMFFTWLVGKLERRLRSNER